MFNGVEMILSYRISIVRLKSDTMQNIEKTTLGHCGGTLQTQLVPFG
jgi:hypothetical protein